MIVSAVSVLHNIFGHSTQVGYCNAMYSMLTMWAHVSAVLKQLKSARDYVVCIKLVFKASRRIDIDTHGNEDYLRERSDWTNIIRAEQSWNYSLVRKLIKCFPYLYLLPP